MTTTKLAETDAPCVEEPAGSQSQPTRESGCQQTLCAAGTAQDTEQSRRPWTGPNESSDHLTRRALLRSAWEAAPAILRGSN